MVNANWDLAGLTDELSRLGKRVGGGSILVPSGIDLNLINDELVWSLRGPGRPAVIEPEPRILDHFVQLWRGKPKAILRFARSWGALCCGSESHSRHLATLLLTHRNSPSTHIEILLKNFRERREFSDLGIDPLFEHREPLSLWRYLSHRANAALNIAAALHQKRVGAIEDWECFWSVCKHADDFKDYEPMSQVELHAYVEEQRISIANVENGIISLFLEANTWLDFGRVGFRVWPAGGPGTGFRMAVSYSFSLLGAIAFQLALTISAAESFFTCSGCGLPYLRRKKRPKPGQSNFCESCDKSGVALRNADRARRERMRQARQLRADGITISEIAKKVGARNLSTVRRWIEKGK